MLDSTLLLTSLSPPCALCGLGQVRAGRLVSRGRGAVICMAVLQRQGVNAFSPPISEVYIGVNHSLVAHLVLLSSAVEENVQQSHSTKTLLLAW